MWDGCLGRITMAKHHIKLLELDTAPVHSAPNRAGAKTREFEMAEIDKILATNVIEPVQTELVALIVFVPK